MSKITNIARILFILSALFSIAAGVVFFVNTPTMGIASRMAMSVALILHGFILFVFGWMIGKTPPRYPRLAAGFIFLSLIAFIFDNLGLVDFLAMGFYLMLLVLSVRISLLTRTQP